MDFPTERRRWPVPKKRAKPRSARRRRASVIAAVLLAGAALFAARTPVRPAPVPAPVPPRVTAHPAAAPIGRDTPTAELPPGGSFTEAGRGRWHDVPIAVPGEFGRGPRHYTYTVEVEDGLDPAAFGGDAAFALEVDVTLRDPRSWIGLGEATLRRVDAGAAPDFRISLTSPGTAHRPDLCGFTIPYESSCNLSVRRRVVVNLARWVRGAAAFAGDLVRYRSYAVNHEVGHALGKSHLGCPADGAPAPVMMQQTFGISNDYVARLNAGDPVAVGRVPADGAVCRPNAWPVAVSAPS